MGHKEQLMRQRIKGLIEQGGYADNMQQGKTKLRYVAIAVGFTALGLAVDYFILR